MWWADLDEADIAGRIMRKENYLIGEAMYYARCCVMINGIALPYI